MALSKTAQKRIRSKARAVEALRLKVAGATLDQIAVKLEISRSQVHKLIVREMKILSEQATAESIHYRAMLTARVESFVPTLGALFYTKDLPTADRLGALDRLHKSADLIAKWWGVAAAAKVTLTNLPNVADGEPTAEMAAALMRDIFKGHVAPPPIEVTPDFEGAAVPRLPDEPDDAPAAAEPSPPPKGPTSPPAAAVEPSAADAAALMREAFRTPQSEAAPKVETSEADRDGDGDDEGVV